MQRSESRRRSIFTASALVGVLLLGAPLGGQDPGQPPESAPKEPEKPAEASDQYPTVAPPEPTLPADLRAAVGQLVKNHRCPDCKGAGQVNREVKEGPITLNKRLDCNKCKGSRYAQQEILERDLDNLVLAWGGMDPEHPEAAAAMDYAILSLKKVVSLNRGRFVELATERTGKAFARGGLERGKAVYFAKAVGARPELLEGNPKGCRITWHDRGWQPFIVLTNGYMDRGGPVFVGGIYAGRTDEANPQKSAHVLRYGFVAALK